MDKFTVFFHREYILRSLYKNDNFGKLMHKIQYVVDDINEIFKFNDWRMELFCVDILIDLRAKDICNKNNYYGLTDFYYNKLFNEFNQNLDNIHLFEDLYFKLMRNKYFKQSLNFLFRCCSDHGIYVSHVKWLSNKEYDSDNMISNIEKYTEPKFWWSVQNSKKYCFLSPSDCELELGIDEESKWIGMHAFFLKIDVDDFNINEFLEYISSQILIARENYHNINKMVIPDVEKKMMEKIEGCGKGSSVKIEGFQNRLLGLMLWDYVNIKKYDLKTAFLEIINGKINYPKMKKCKYSKGIGVSCVGCNGFKKCFDYINLLYAVAEESVIKGCVVSSNQRKR